MDSKKFIRKCQKLVAEYTNSSKVEAVDKYAVVPEEVYTVWYCKTLQNQKVLLGTPLSDGMYYECTYNGDKNEIYFDAYKKVENNVVSGGK